MGGEGGGGGILWLVLELGILALAQVNITDTRVVHNITMAEVPLTEILLSDTDTKY